MTDLKMTSYEGRDITRGEALLISDGDGYETRPRCIAVALHDIPAAQVDKAQRIAELNGLHLSDMLARQSAVTLHPLSEMICDTASPKIEVRDAQDGTAGKPSAQDHTLARFLDAYAAAKATTGEDAEDPLEERVARLDHLYRELRLDFE